VNAIVCMLSHSSEVVWPRKRPVSSAFVKNHAQIEQLIYINMLMYVIVGTCYRD